MTRPPARLLALCATIGVVTTAIAFALDGAHLSGRFEAVSLVLGFLGLPWTAAGFFAATGTIHPLYLGLTVALNSLLIGLTIQVRSAGAGLRLALSFTLPFVLFTAGLLASKALRSPPADTSHSDIAWLLLLLAAAVGGLLAGSLAPKGDKRTFVTLVFALFLTVPLVLFGLEAMCILGQRCI
jgi:hypothetical protein